MADYPYPYPNGDEKFQVDESDSCEIKVSDGVHTLSITPNSTGPSVYKVSTVKGGWWWHTNTVRESVDRACQDLIDSRKVPTPEEACKDMSEFVESLG